MADRSFASRARHRKIGKLDGHVKSRLRGLRGKGTEAEGSPRPRSPAAIDPVSSASSSPAEGCPGGWLRGTRPSRSWGATEAPALEGPLDPPVNFILTVQQVLRGARSACSSLSIEGVGGEPDAGTRSVQAVWLPRQCRTTSGRAVCPVVDARPRHLVLPDRDATQTRRSTATAPPWWVLLAAGGAASPRLPMQSR
jgi:hypothetical protein